MHDKTEALKLIFPTAGISVGYIGNCGTNSNGAFDDRRWMIFTKIKVTGSPNCLSLDISGPEFPLLETAEKLAALIDRTRVRETAVRPLKQLDAFIAGEYSRTE
jgi:hypothetical protein